VRDGVPSRIIFVRVKPYFVTYFALSRNIWILVVSVQRQREKGPTSGLGFIAELHTWAGFWLEFALKVS
jgi:hypothetical protein